MTTNLESTARLHPHGTRLNLSIFEPKILLAGQIDDSVIGFGEVEIYFTNFSTGSVSNLYEGATMLIGTEPGQDDVGRIRVRSWNDFGGATTVMIAENSIPFVDQLFVTILGYVEIAAIYPKITQSGGNVTFKKDDDILYSGQNSTLGSFICMGSDYAGFLDGGQEDVYYSATGTYNVKGESLAYFWEFEGGSPTGSTALTPGFVTYNTPGHYTTKLIVSGSASADISYRYVSIYDRPNEGSFNPVLDWGITQDLSGSRSEAGYTMGIRVRQNMSQVQPNALVVLFADEFYGTTDGSIGGNQPNRESIKFVGYIIEDSIEFNYRDGFVDFRVASVTDVMKQADGFSISVETSANPTTWFKLLDMDVQRAIYHYLRWQSTVLLRTDFQYTGENLKFQYFDSDRSSLFDAIDSLMKNLAGQLVADRQGKLWAEQLPWGRANPLSPETAMTILKQDWVGTPSIRERRTTQMSLVEFGGIAFSGVSTGTYSAFLTNAPSETPLYRGKPERVESFILSSQDRLNSMSGHYLATKNSRFPEIDFAMNGNYSNLDIAPIEFVKPHIATEDTPRGIAIQSRNYIVERMDWSFNATDGLFTPDVGLSEMATGTAGVTLTIPSVPDDSGFTVPDIKVPPLPDLFFPAGQGSTSTGTTCCDDLATLLGLYSDGQYCVTAEKSFIYVNTPLSSDPTGLTWKFDTTNNPNMHQISSGTYSTFRFLNMDAEDYQFVIDVDWSVIGATTVEAGLHLLIYDGNGNSLGSIVPEVFSGLTGDGHSSDVQTLTDANFKFPNFIRVSYSGSTDPELGTTNVLFSNIKFSMCKV